MSLDADLPAEPRPLRYSEWAEPSEQRFALEFTGRWQDYWRIWIVNLSLSILTLGVYSAWAKVRSKRWFYGHLAVDGSSFAYHGQPVPILRGRLITAALAITWLVCTRIGPIWMLSALGVFVLLLPWLIVRAAAFRAWNSSWRGVRFSFRGHTGGAFVRYALPVVCVVVLGVLGWIASTEAAAARAPGPGALLLLPLAAIGFGYPFMLAAQKRFLVNHHRFGGSAFRFLGGGGQLFQIYFLAGLLFFPIGLLDRLLDLVTQPAIDGTVRLLAGLGQPWLLVWAWLIVPVMLAPLLLLASAPALFGLGYLRGRSAVWQWDQTRLGEHARFECRPMQWDMAWCYFTNALVLAPTLGLLAPWAMVRTARLRASSLTLVSSRSLEEFVTGASSGVGATGDEVGDLMGFDVGI